MNEAGFEGYASSDATRSKLVRDEDGSLWFRTGDVFRSDADGYLYFVDRMGDSFRWKGENISSEQVASAIESCEGVSRAIVYGVRVAGAEGRAGMALIEPDHEDRFDPSAFGGALRNRLGHSSMPLFLRIGRVNTLTATYKVRTSHLRAQGYGPCAAGDQLFLLDASGDYVALNASSLARNRLSPFVHDED
jgi:fatty-acyl-CoA synthase